MTELQINSLQEKYNMIIKSDYHALISEHRMENKKFCFFGYEEKNPFSHDLYDFVAFALGFKHVIMIHELHVNDEGYQTTVMPTQNNEYSLSVIQKDPILENILKDKIFYCHKLEDKFKQMYIYSETGIMMYEILKNHHRDKNSYFSDILVGKCLSYSDEDIEFFIMRLDFMNYMEISGFNLSQQSFMRDNLDSLREYRKWWILNKRSQYLKDYDEVMKYIDDFKKSYKLDITSHKRFNFISHDI